MAGSCPRDGQATPKGYSNERHVLGRLDAYSLQRVALSLQFFGIGLGRTSRAYRTSGPILRMVLVIAKKLGGGVIGLRRMVRQSKC